MLKKKYIINFERYTKSKMFKERSFILYIDKLLQNKIHNVKKFDYYVSYFIQIVNKKKGNYIIHMHTYI